MTSEQAPKHGLLCRAWCWLVGHDWGNEHARSPVVQLYLVCQRCRKRVKLA
jgi:hypothetical protein